VQNTENEMGDIRQSPYLNIREGSAFWRPEKPTLDNMRWMGSGSQFRKDGGHSSGHLRAATNQIQSRTESVTGYYGKPGSLNITVACSDTKPSNTERKSKEELCDDGPETGGLPFSWIERPAQLGKAGKQSSAMKIAQCGAGLSIPLEDIDSCQSARRGHSQRAVF
jgi:hypothetical protein